MTGKPTKTLRVECDLMVDIIYNDQKLWKVCLFYGELRGTSSIVNGDGKFLNLLKDGGKLGMEEDILLLTM